MAQAATMNIEIFRALRDSGMEEQYATRVAGAIPPADSIATKADIADLRGHSRAGQFRRQKRSRRCANQSEDRRSRHHPH